MTITLKCGDVIEQLKELPDDSVDAIIADPPYNLVFMGKKWDNKGAPKQFEEWCCAWATECLRVLRRGGYLLSFGGTRTFHRMISGIEDAGFVIRDCLSWNFGSGFPKGQNISKAIDQAAGAKREIIGTREPFGREGRKTPMGFGEGNLYGEGSIPNEVVITKPSTVEAEKWDGYGTTLKPAWEPITLAQKPFKGTIANNVVTHGVGGMNIEATRIGIEKIESGRKGRSECQSESYGEKLMGNEGGESIGRWPANTIFDEEAGSILDTQYSGGVSRFFYCPKIPKKERTCKGHVENTHPTVKPLKLMEYLISLICPTVKAMGRIPVVLDCFVGSGSTAIAAHRLGVDCIGIDISEEYLEITRLRLENDWRLHKSYSMS